jgi:hypothetical protein
MDPCLEAAIFPDVVVRLNDEFLVAVQDDALAAARFMQARAQFGKVFVTVDDVAFDRLVGGSVVPAVFERKPTTAELSCCRGPT